MRIIVTLVISLIICQLAEAQNCFWQLNKESYFVGDKFVATLVIPEVELKTDPIMEQSDAFFFHFLEKNSVEKDNKRTTLYRYQFVSLKGGEHMLPVVVFPSNKNLMCTAQVLQVRTPEQNPNLKLHVRLSEKECFQHQPIDLIFTWMSAVPLNNIKAVNIEIPFFYRNDFKVYVPPYTANVEEGKIGLPVSGNRIVANICDSVINKVAYKIISFRLTVVPEKQGAVEIESATLLCSYIKEKTSFTSYPAYFDNNLFDQEEHTNYKRLVAKSKRMRLNVKELPATNRPANFSGLFGDFGATVRLSKSEIKTGEPFQLIVEVQNYKHSAAFCLPDFNSLLPDKHSFRYTKAEPGVSVSDSLIILKKRIRINSVDVVELPALEIPYFDLKKEKFGFIKTKAIGLQVVQGVEESSIASGDSITTIKKIQVTENANGINQIYIGTKALKSANKNQGAWFWILLFIFPVLFFSYSFFYKRYTHPFQIKKRRIKKAIRTFNRKEYKTETEFEKGLTHFFQHAFNEESKLLLPQKIEELIETNVKNIDVGPIIDFYAEYFKKCYDKIESEGPIATEGVRACVNQISKSVLKS